MKLVRNSEFNAFGEIFIWSGTVLLLNTYRENTVRGALLSWLQQ